jgi:hypothetical protein
MSMPLSTKSQTSISPAAANTLWIALIAALSVGGSYIYACAAPFAAVAALAATKMDRASGLTLVLLAWLANQAVGYGLLQYPQTASSFAWGGAIGLAAVAGFFAARLAAKVRPHVVALAVSFLAAFAVYELALYAAGFFLGSSEEAFSAEVVGQILATNAVSFAGLLILHRIAGIVAWLRPATAPVEATA